MSKLFSVTYHRADEPYTTPPTGPVQLTAAELRNYLEVPHINNYNFINIYENEPCSTLTEEWDPSAIRHESSPPPRHAGCRFFRVRLEGEGEEGPSAFTEWRLEYGLIYEDGHYPLPNNYSHLNGGRPRNIYSTSISPDSIYDEFLQQFPTALGPVPGNNVSGGSSFAKNPFGRRKRRNTKRRSRKNRRSKRRANRR